MRRKKEANESENLIEGIEKLRKRVDLISATLEKDGKNIPKEKIGKIKEEIAQIRETIRVWMERINFAQEELEVVGEDKVLEAAEEASKIMEAIGRERSEGKTYLTYKVIKLIRLKNMLKETMKLRRKKKKGNQIQEEIENPFIGCYLDGDETIKELQQKEGEIEREIKKIMLELSKKKRKTTSKIKSQSEVGNGKINNVRKAIKKEEARKARSNNEEIEESMRIFLVNGSSDVYRRRGNEE